MKVCFPNNNTTFLTASYNICFFQKTIYDAVEGMRLQFRKSDLREVPIKETIPLNKIINLHDNDGLSMEKIRTIIAYLKKGKHLLPGGFPNIKMVKYGQKYILFDGHHTLIAYCFLGRHLREIPHLMVIKEDIKSCDLHVFYGQHEAKLTGENTWDKFVINWYAPEPFQLQKRKSRNFQELFNSIKDI